MKGTTVYTYTVLSQLSTVTGPSGKVTSYTYDNAGNRSSETVTENGASTTTIYTTDEANRLISTVEEREDKTVINNYHYDPAGNLLSRVPESYTSTTAGSGALPRPMGTEASPLQPADMVAAFEMDKADPGTTSVPDNYAVTGISGGNPSLRMSQDVPGLYTYNAKNQMVKAEIWENGVDKTVENTFNYQGYRISKTSRAKTTYYTYVGDKVIKELDSTGGLVYNVYGLSRISRTVNGEKAYYLYNGHGDVTALVNANKTILARYYYDAFGNILEGDINFPNPYLYAGYTYDQESGLYDLKARFYDAKIARFMQEDTCLGNSTDPLSLNLYTYCYNNPIRYWDPTGHVVTVWDLANCTPSQIAIIQAATNAYNSATTQAQKDAAHAAAQAARAGANASLRDLATAAGASNISWDDQTKAATVTIKGITQTFNTSGSNSYASINGRIIIDSNTFDKLFTGTSFNTNTAKVTSNVTTNVTPDTVNAKVTTTIVTASGQSQSTRNGSVTNSFKSTSNFNTGAESGSGNDSSTSANQNINSLLDVACGEIGYVQSGNTKYGVWYNSFEDEKNRVYASAAWCVMFASYCAGESELLYNKNTNPNGLFPRMASTQAMIDWYAEKGRYATRIDKEGEYYIPQAGDLIFFKWVSSGNGHTGIVESYDPDTKTVHTIEGNTSRKVKDKDGNEITEWVVQRKSWNLDDKNIRGYGENSK